MLQFFKDRLPPSRRLFERRSRELEQKIERLSRQADDLGRQAARLADLQQQTIQMLRDQTALIEQLPSEAPPDENAAREQNLLEKINATARETLWGEVFHDTIRGSGWLLDRTFSPGRWSAGYPLLYVLYRVLNEKQPRAILELGLGQTTRMIAQYAAACGAAHDLVEHDEQWIRFFTDGQSPLPAQTRLVRLDLAERAWLDDEHVISYQGFREIFAGRSYGLIVIDGPYGGKNSRYSRVDVLEMMPDILDSSFVILLDDYNRRGEQQTYELIRKTLAGHGIDYCSAVYRGEKNVMLIASKDNAFFSTL